MGRGGRLVAAVTQIPKTPVSRPGSHIGQPMGVSVRPPTPVIPWWDHSRVVDHAGPSAEADAGSRMADHSSWLTAE